MISSVVYNGQTYSRSEFGNCTNIVRNMIVYHKGNYYRFIATSADTAANPVILLTTAWENLGSSFLIPQEYSIKLQGNTTDAEATGDYGKSDINAYHFSISQDGGNTWETKTSPNKKDEYTFPKLSKGKTYTLKMKAVDNAEEFIETKSITVTVPNAIELKEASDVIKRQYKFGKVTVGDHRSN